MSFWESLLAVVVSFVLLKLAQILVWNVRKSFYVHPWVIEIVVVVLALLTLWLLGSLWWQIVIFGVLLGVLRGDQEADQGQTRKLM